MFTRPFLLEPKHNIASCFTPSQIRAMGIFLSRGLVSSSLAFTFFGLFCWHFLQPFLFSWWACFGIVFLKTRIETVLFSEWKPHFWRSIFGRAWKQGLKIYQSFLACAEAWRQRRRRSKVSFILFRMTLFQPFAVKMLQKIASLLTSKYYSQQRLVNKLL